MFGAGNPQESLLQIVIMSKNWLSNVTPQHGYYIAGFADGEGSFNVSVKKRSDYQNGWKLSASFNISQKDRVILAQIKKVLGCGTLRERQDGVVYYEVTNISSLHDRIIPFFSEFNFLSSRKKNNFSTFKQIVERMYSKDHLEKDGFEEILELRSEL
ncbi:MAG: hypothetical protein BRC24_00215, partial [Parcubacteria group bacterium SW_4_46_8]